MKPDRRRPFGRNLASLRWWRRPAEDVREELELHAELRARELEAEGVPADEARARAWREAGQPSVVVPEVVRLAAAGDRASAIRQWLDEMWLDLRYAFRSARRTPGFSLLTVTTIALALGANAAIFGVVRAAVFTPLPFDREGTLVRVREYRTLPNGTRQPGDASRRTADSVATRSDLFTRSVPVSGVSRTLATDAGAVRVAATRVAPGFTGVVGLTPVLGRTFTREEEDAADNAGVALVSHRFWRLHLGGGSDALGKVLRLDGRPHRVVGVLPQGFHVPYESDLWFPTRFGERERSIFILARLTPGVVFDALQPPLDVMARELNERYPDDVRGMGVMAVRARDYFVARQDRAAVALMAAVALLLLIGGTNVAVLLTTRFAARSNEVAVRAALGCSRARQMRQFVTEGLVLFVAGGGVGLLMASWLKDVLVVFLPEALATQAGIDDVPLDWMLTTFAIAVSVCCGLGFGTLAARRVSGGDPGAAIKTGGRALAGSMVRGALGRLVVVEVALAVVLLAAAGVMADTFRRLHERDLGFDPTGVVTVRFEFGAERYAEADARLLLVDRVLDRVRAIPGVESAALTTVNPMCCGDWGMLITAEGQPPMPAERLPAVQHFIVTPGYFETMRQRVVEGRGITPADATGAEPAVVIDRAAAERFWPGERAVGKRMKRGGPTVVNPWLTVVGVVETVIDEGDYPEAWYLPLAQHPTAPSTNGAHLMVRTSGDPNGLVATIRRVVAEIDPGLALYEPALMEALIADNIRQNRLAAGVASIFAAAGLLLAAMGLYGVLAYAVNAGRREIGVRLALGASRRAVLGLVAGRGLRLTAIGLGIGALAAYGVIVWLARLIEGAQFDLRPLLFAIAALAIAALLAILVPARRALRVDPLRALRSE